MHCLAHAKLAVDTSGQTLVERVLERCTEVHSSSKEPAP